MACQCLGEAGRADGAWRERAMRVAVLQGKRTASNGPVDKKERGRRPRGEVERIEEARLHPPASPGNAPERDAGDAVLRQFRRREEVDVLRPIRPRIPAS